MPYKVHEESYQSSEDDFNETPFTQQATYMQAQMALNILQIPNFNKDENEDMKNLRKKSVKFLSEYLD